MNTDKIRKWLRGRFPGLYKRFGHRFHTYERLRRRILRDAARHPDRYADPDIAAATEALRRGGISVFSYPGHERYDSLAVEVHIDEEGWPWVDRGGKRLYFRRGTDPGRVERYCRGLMREQDPASPHCYDARGFGVREGDVLLDIGSAEGIWALDNIERAARVFLFEAAPEWIGALERTFEPWRDKVTIIGKFVSDTDSAGGGEGDAGGAGRVTIDRVVREEAPDGPTVLKLDVEGAEEDVLRGAEETLARRDTRAAVCTYHRAGDHERLSEIMRRRGYEVDTSRGVMLFVFDRDLQPPFFRRGVIYCTK